METVVNYLPAILCGAMFLSMCIPMIRNMHKERSSDGELTKMREEIERLKAGRTPESTRERTDG